MVERSCQPLLLVEDSDEDYETFKRILRRSCDVELSLIRCCDGDEALDFLYRRRAYADRSSSDMPAMIVLDLNLPGTDGRDVLTQIKQDEALCMIPVVVMTTSSNPKDIRDCYRAGTNSYILKPTNINQLKESIRSLIDYWFKVAVSPATM